jgi:hypothetical protein
MFGHFSDETLELFIKMSCEVRNLDYSETFDFARCQRPDGSFYGTRGLCAAPSKSVGPARGRNVLERNRLSNENKAIDKLKSKMDSNPSTMGKMASKPPKGAAWVQKGQENKHGPQGQKSDRVLGSPAAKSAISKAATNIKSSGGGGNKSGLSDAQLAAIFAKLGKGGKGGKGRGR